MKNREFYREEILKPNRNFCEDFIRPKILKRECQGGTNFSCDQCVLVQAMWLEEEYEPPAEPEVDWSKVEVDTPVLVSDDKESWERGYFSRYDKELDLLFVWNAGKTSWTSSFEECWIYAKLAEGESNE